MHESAWGDPQTKYFFGLGPDRVLDAVEAAGYVCTGLCYPLNSYENRVYEVEVEEDPDLGVIKTDASSLRRIVKFYRPGRWSREQIEEEHRFLAELVDAEIPAVPPLSFPDGETLWEAPDAGVWYTIFPKVGGRMNDELNADQLEMLGRLLARLHNVGASGAAPHRPALTPSTYGLANLNYLLEHDQLPAELRDSFTGAVGEICRLSEPLFERADYHRVHGDCHLGNILWDRGRPFLVDFDDLVRAPAVQDLWLLVPGRDEESRRNLALVIESYEQLRAFDRGQFALIEPLRALRFVHFAAWIARRWQDPAFPQAFPHFGTQQYWAELTRDLHEQLALIREGPAGHPD